MPNQTVVAVDYYAPGVSFKIHGKWTTMGRLEPLSLWRAIRRYKPRIVTPHDLISTLMSCTVKPFTGYRFRITAFLYDRETLMDHPVISTLLRAFMSLGVLDDIIVLDRQMEKLAKERLRTNRVRILRIGVPTDTSVAGPKEPTSYRSDFRVRYVIFFHGIIVPRRRIEDLLSALAKLNRQDIALLIGGRVGDRMYYARLNQMVEKLGLGRVYFLGPLDERKLDNLYQDCDIFVWPCNDQTWGLAPLEAMLRKRPTIVCTGSGVSEVLHDKVAALVPPCQPDRLAQAIDHLLADDRLRRELGERARQFVLDQLTFKKTMTELSKIWS